MDHLLLSPHARELLGGRVLDLPPLIQDPGDAIDQALWQAEPTHHLFQHRQLPFLVFQKAPLGSRRDQSVFDPQELGRFQDGSAFRLGHLGPHIMRAADGVIGLPLQKLARLGRRGESQPGCLPVRGRLERPRQVLGTGEVRVAGQLLQDFGQLERRN